MTLLQEAPVHLPQPRRSPELAPPPPTAREERDRRTAELVEELRDAGSPTRREQLREELITVNMPVALLLSRRYRNRGETDDDLEQVALMGLTQAANRFDPAVTTSFHGYCVPTILGELRRHFRDRGWVVRPPRSLQELQQQVLATQARLTTALDRTPTAVEIATELGREVGDVEEALGLRSCYSPASLDKPVGHEGDSASLGELLPGTDGEHHAAEARVALAPALRHLAERDRRVIRLRFVDGLTQREIAEDIGVTQMQVSRVLARIFEDMRATIGRL